MSTEKRPCLCSEGCKRSADDAALCQWCQKAGCQPCDGWQERIVADLKAAS